MALSNGLPLGRAAAPEWFFGRPDQRGGIGCKAHTAQIQRQQQPADAGGCAPVQKHHPSADFTERPVRQIPSHMLRYRVLMGWLFAQPGFRHHQLQRRRCGAYEILTASQYSSWALYWSQAITANFCRLIPSFGNSRRGTAAPTSANFSPCSLHRSSPISRIRTTPSIPASASKQVCEGFLSGRSSYRPMRPGCDSAYARC